MPRLPLFRGSRQFVAERCHIVADHRAINNALKEAPSGKNLPRSGKPAHNNERTETFDLYVVRIALDENGNTIYRDAKPCKHCLPILRQYGVRRVFYTQTDSQGHLSYQVERVDEMTTDHVTYGIARILSLETKERSGRT